jgi:hypothetical protein
VGDGVCFSAEADLIAGVVVTAAGVDALRHVRHRREVALAALPLVFGVHQLVGVPVWLGVDGRGSPGLGQSAAWWYLLIAFGLVPWFVPWAVRRQETDLERRRLMGRLVVLGSVVAVALTIPLMVGPVEVTDGGHYLAYAVPLVGGGLLTVLYVVATCGTLLLSSDRVLVVWGLVNLVVVSVLAVLLTSGVISLWCVWAAVTSVGIAVHLRRPRIEDTTLSTTATA